MGMPVREGAGREAGKHLGGGAVAGLGLGVARGGDGCAGIPSPAG